MTSPEHPDLSGELGQRSGQALAILATLAEAGARLGAEERRRRERTQQLTERQDDLNRLLLQRQQETAAEAERLHAERDRQHLDIAETDSWTQSADLRDLATAWRVARTREGQPGFDNAARVAGTVEDRLRERYPGPLRSYDDLVAAGVSRATAMRFAVHEMFGIRPARPAGRRGYPVLTGRPDAGLDDHITAERTHLRDQLPTDARSHYDRMLRDLGVLSPAAEKAVRELLANPSLKSPEDTTVNQPTPEPGQRRASDIAAEFYPDGPTIPPPSTRPPGPAPHRNTDLRHNAQRTPRRHP